MINPYKTLFEITGLDVTQGAGDLRARYLRDYGAGRVAEKLWNDSSFTLGFEYGLLALAAFTEEKKK